MSEGCRGNVAGRGEVGAVVGEHRVHPVGHGLDQVAQEVTGYAARGPRVQLDEGEPGGPVDGHEQLEPAFGRMHLGEIDVEVAGRVGFEAGPLRLVPVDLG